MTIVCLNLSLVIFRSPSTSRLVLLSRFPVGSSARMIAGFVASAGDGDPLLLTAGELARKTVDLLRKPQRLNNTVDMSFIRFSAVQLDGKDDVSVDIQNGHQIVALKDKTDFSASENGEFVIFQRKISFPETVTVPEVGRSRPPII